MNIKIHKINECLFWKVHVFSAWASVDTPIKMEGVCNTVNTPSHLAFNPFIGKWANCRVVRTEKVGDETVTVFL
jgi:hypothetical protein